MASRGYFFVLFTYFFLFSEYYAAFCRKLQMQSRQRLQHRGFCGGGSTYSRTQVRIYYFLLVICVLHRLFHCLHIRVQLFNMHSVRFTARVFCTLFFSLSWDTLPISVFFSVSLVCLVFISEFLFFSNLLTINQCWLLGIRIRMFLGLQDPDPLLRGADPVPSLFWNNACKTGFYHKILATT